MKTLPVAKFGTIWTDLEIVSEPNVILTFRGYAPIVLVRIEKSGITKVLYLSAKSLATPLEELREKNGGKFQGLKLRIRKESDEKLAKYVVESRG